MQPSLLRWAACVAFAAVPMVLYVSMTAIFGAGDRQLKNVLADDGFTTLTLVSFPDSKLGSLAFTFSIYSFVHVALCLSIAVYFIVMLLKHGARRPGGALLPLFLLLASIAVLFAVLGIGAGLWPAPGADKASAGFNMVIQPYLEFFGKFSAIFPFDRFDKDPLGFLALCVFLPPAFGIGCVILASGAFNMMVETRQRKGEDGWAQDFAASVNALQMQVALMSLVLVSSTLTARAYFQIVPSLISPQHADYYSAYAELSSNLATGAGIMFTLVLLATFAPGAIRLASELYDLKLASTNDAFDTLLNELNLADLSAKLSGLLRGFIAVAAPALAAPVMDVIGRILN